MEMRENMAANPDLPLRRRGPLPDRSIRYPVFLIMIAAYQSEASLIESGQLAPALSALFSDHAPAPGAVPFRVPAAETKMPAV